MDLSQLDSLLQKVNGSKKEAKQRLNWMPKLSIGSELKIRILPAKSGGLPLHVVYRHKNGHPWQATGKNPYATTFCLGKNDGFGDDCPLCKYTDNLWDLCNNEEDPQKKEDLKKMASSFMAKTEFAAEIVIRGRESEGLFYWTPNKDIFETLILTMKNPEYGDISDLEKGTDIILSKVKSSNPMLKHGEYKVTFVRNPSHLSKSTNGTLSEKEVQDLLDQRLESIYDQHYILEKDQIMKNLQEFLAATGGDDEEVEGNQMEYHKEDVAKEAPKMDLDQFSDALSSFDDDGEPPF